MSAGDASKDDQPRDTLPLAVQSARAAAPVGAYPHARRGGTLLFLSGVGPRQRRDNSIPGLVLGADGRIESYDFEAQVHATIANMRAVVEDAGANWTDLVDVTAFLTDMRRDFAAYNRIWASEFGGHGQPWPTRTTVEVGALPTAIAFELKGVVWVGDRPATAHRIS